MLLSVMGKRFHSSDLNARPHPRFEPTTNDYLPTTPSPFDASPLPSFHKITPYEFSPPRSTLAQHGLDPYCLLKSHTPLVLCAGGEGGVGQGLLAKSKNSVMSGIARSSVGRELIDRHYLG
jgi:hypothetical protein